MAEIQDKERPVLSISLLVSNRVDTIRKCMESLRPLREAVRSELIAVDTGGTDGSMEIVREYTDNIVKFQWCDDFAAARNAGLRLASGEWFLFLDDDEWFEDTSEIEDFFLSGEYRNYKSAQYQVRNYASAGGYADAYVSRMCKLNNKVHFVGSIHEYFKIENGPIKYFNSFVHHYGYCYRTEEERQSHFERNTTLLKKELRKNPTDIRLLCQLAQEYETVRDLENEEAVCRLALNNVPEAGIQTSTGMNWIMAALVRILAFQGKSENALKEGKRMLERRLPYELSRAVILAHMTEEALKIKDYHYAVRCAGEYMALINALEENPETASSQCMLTMTFSYAKSLCKAVLEEGVEACCGAGDFSEAEILLEWLFDGDKNTDLDNTCSAMERLKEKYPEAVAGLTYAMARIQTSGQHPYLLLQQLFAKDVEKGKELQEIYDNCVFQCLKQQKFFASLLSVAGEKHLNHKVMLEQLERKEWEDWLCASISSIPEAALYGIKESLTPSVEKNDLKRLSFLVTLERQMLIQKTEQAKNNAEENRDDSISTACIKSLRDYCCDGLIYFRRLYRPEVFTEEKGINLPKECRYLLNIEEAFVLESKGDISGSLGKVKEAIYVNPPMAGTLNEYLSYLEKKAAAPVSDEFRSLGEKVKGEVYRLMEEGKSAEAVTILKQLEELLPGDMEIMDMLQKAAR